MEKCHSAACWKRAEPDDSMPPPSQPPGLSGDAPGSMGTGTCQCDADREARQTKRTVAKINGQTRVGGTDWDVEISEYTETCGESSRRGSEMPLLSAV